MDIPLLRDDGDESSRSAGIATVQYAFIGTNTLHSILGQHWNVELMKVQKVNHATSFRHSTHVHTSADREYRDSELQTQYAFQRRSIQVDTPASLAKRCNVAPVKVPKVQHGTSLRRN